MATAINVKF